MLMWVPCSWESDQSLGVSIIRLFPAMDLYKKIWVLTGLKCCNISSHDNTMKRLQFLQLKNQTFHIKRGDFLIISAKHIDFGYSFQPPQSKSTQNMLLAEIRGMILPKMPWYLNIKALSYQTGTRKTWSLDGYFLSLVILYMLLGEKGRKEQAPHNLSIFFHNMDS